MEIIENALATDPGSKRALDEDTDAVLSPRLLLFKVATAVLAPPPALWLPVSVAIAYGVVLLMRIWATDDYYTDLQNLNRGFTAVATCLLALSLFSLRRVTRVDGQLGQLGMGVVFISARSARTLTRWNMGLMLVVGICLFQGIFVAGKYGVLGRHKDDNPIYHLEPGETELTVLQRANGLLWGLVAGLLYPCLLVWYLTLKEASLLVFDEVVETRRTIVGTSVESAGWTSVVVPQVLKLIDKTLPALSEGWGDGLVAIWVGCWVQGIGVFCLFLQSYATHQSSGHHIFGMIGVVVYSLGPLIIAHDVAGASSACDSIVMSLNEKRKASLPDCSAAAEEKLQQLERAISLENRGMGIGFVVLGRVVDRSTLTTVFGSMSALLGTVIPIFLALQPHRLGSADTALCSLSDSEVRSIQGLLSGRNQSCLYNVTIDTVLGL